MFPESETLRAVDLLLDRYRRPAIMLHRPYPPLNLPETRSRLGGLPLLPDAFAWPRGRCNGVEVPLHFLAQIDCAELPRIDRRMPASGMLFFFGRDDEEQLWGDTKPQDDVRVIYAPVVAEDQPERAAPSDLLPIRGTYSPYPWVLPKEAGPSVHASWPVVPLRIDSWPDLSSIYGTETYRQIATPDIGIFGMFDRLMFAMKTGKRLPKPEGHRETAVARQKFEELYRRRLNASRIGAIVAATELPTRAEVLPTSWGKDVLRLRSTTESQFVLPSDLRMKPMPFPQAGIMIDRIARLVVQQALSYARHSFQRDLAAREYLARVEADARAWIDRANEIGLDTAPSDEDIARFTAWLKELSSDTPAPAHTAEASRFSESFRSSAAFAKGSSRAPASASRRPVLKGSLPEVFTKALQSCITFAASSPRTAALIPPYFYNVLENNYLPFDQSKHGHYVMCDDWRLNAKIHQMLGYEMSCQDAATVGEKNVLLLQLHSDQGLYMGFGDVGAASFWIKADDLKARKFDKAWGEIVGH